MLLKENNKKEKQLFWTSDKRLFTRFASPKILQTRKSFGSMLSDRKLSLKASDMLRVWSSFLFLSKTALVVFSVKIPWLRTDTGNVLRKAFYDNFLVDIMRVIHHSKLLSLIREVCEKYYILYRIVIGIAQNKGLTMATISCEAKYLWGSEVRSKTYSRCLPTFKHHSSSAKFVDFPNTPFYYYKEFIGWQVIKKNIVIKKRQLPIFSDKKKSSK